MNADFQPLFDTAVHARGSAYREARDALVTTDHYQGNLRAALHSSGDWRARWVARIALAWHADPALFAEADTYLRGDLEGPRPITGIFGVDPRTGRVVGLGDAVVPRLVEAAWKTQEYEEYARGAVFEALKAFDTPDAAETASLRPPLRSLLSPETPDRYRTAAMLTLGDLHDTESAGPLRRFLHDPAEPTPVRTAALHACWSLNLEDTSELLAGVLRTPTNPESLRVNAASFLQMRDEPGTHALYHDLIPTTPDGLLLVTLVDGLDLIGDETSIPVLETLQDRSEDPNVLDLIDEVLFRLSL